MRGNLISTASFLEVAEHFDSTIHPSHDKKITLVGILCISMYVYTKFCPNGSLHTGWDSHNVL